MQKKNGLIELRANLFTVMEKLMDEENPMEIERAKAIANVGQTIINSATLEVRAINAMSIAGGSPKKSEFFELEEESQWPRALPPKPNGGAPPNEGIHSADPLHSARRAEPRGRDD